MSNVKPGDRAIVIKSSKPVNLAKVVVVIEEIRPGAEIERGFIFAPQLFALRANPPYWRCETLGGPFSLTGILGDTEQFNVAPVPDAWLRRLDPPEETTDELDVGAPVKDSQTVEVQS